MVGLRAKCHTFETASGTVSESIESVNRKFGGRFTIRNFEPVINGLGIGYLPVTGWM